MNPETQIPSRSDLDRAARRREYNRQWRAANPEKVRDQGRRSREKHADRNREYSRKWRAENEDHLREYYREYNKKHGPARRQAIRAIEHAEARDRFALERQRERRRHLQMKAAKLRRSILRSGEYSDTIWLGNIMSDLVRYVADHVPVDDQLNEVEPVFLDFRWAPVSSAA
jgi:hypothetical protein